MAKLVACALALALVSLLLLNLAYAQIPFADRRDHLDEATKAAGNVAVDVMDKASTAVHEAGKGWSTWLGGFFSDKGPHPNEQESGSTSASASASAGAGAGAGNN